jgi:hypothetical protein
MSWIRSLNSSVGVTTTTLKKSTTATNELRIEVVKRQLIAANVVQQYAAARNCSW